MTSPVESPRDPAEEEKARLFYESLADMVDMIHDPVFKVFSERKAGSNLPEGVAKACAMQALCLFGVTIARDAQIPTIVIVNILEQTLAWVKDPKHPLGIERDGDGVILEKKDEPSTPPT